jgi:tRNA(Ile)-lysidine synthase
VLSTAVDSSLSGVFDAFDLSSSPTLIVAVSGGSDSLALLSLLARQVPASRLVAVTIDHGLRPESAAEAHFVANLCAIRSIRHATLRWEGEKPDAGLAAAARDARYRLLRHAAANHGSSIILAGHTEDDQAETVAMRAERGEGRGLAGMAPATLLDGTAWLLRPLLGIRRATLRAMLEAEGIEWIDDPSNDNMASERVRIRRRLADGAERDALLKRATAAAAQRFELGRHAAEAIERHASAPSPGLIRLDPAFIHDANGPAAVYALRLLLATAGGTLHLPGEAHAGALLDRLGEPALRASLSRAIIERRHNAIFLRREMRGLPAPMPVEDGGVWDGRFRICDSGQIVAPLGMAGARKLDAGDVDAPPPLVHAAFATLPALLRDVSSAGQSLAHRDPSLPPPLPLPTRGRGTQLPLMPSGLPRTDAERSAAGFPSPLWGGAGVGVAVHPTDADGIGPPRLPDPADDGPSAKPVAAPFARYLPSFDLAPARALAALVGGELPPAPPYRGHSAGEA